MRASLFNPSRVKHLASRLQIQHPRALSFQSSPKPCFSAILAKPWAIRNTRLILSHGRVPVFRANFTSSTLSFADVKPDEIYQMSLDLSRAPVNGNAQVQFTVYKADGAEPVTNKLTKHDVAKEYNLTPRDLRTFDLPSEGFPHILIREKTVLIHMFSLRLLVQADRVLLINLEDTVGAEGEVERDVVSRVFRHKLEEKMREGHGLHLPVNTPFELRVLEVALASVTSALEAEYVLTKQHVSEALQILDRDERVIHSELRSMLELMRTLADVEEDARHVRGAIQEVLNEDQDMADLHLTDRQAGKRHAPEDHQDVEYLLEAYYKASDAVVQKTASLMRNIKQTEETIQSILNVRRNQIMVLEAKIEIAMLGLASATLLAGLYGMNVINYFEDSPWAFGVLSATCLVGTALIGRYGMRQLLRIQKVQPKKPAKN